MNKRLKRIGLILSVAALGIVTGVSVFASSPKEVADVEAVITGNDVRIAVVRPSWWENNRAGQFLRIAPTADDLTNNKTTNITYVQIESYTADTYYTTGAGYKWEAGGYDTNGVVFYDVPLTTLTGKYFDLSRIEPDDYPEPLPDPLPETTYTFATAEVWNKTAPELWNDNLLHKIWRIWGDGNGIYRPEGELAESRAVSNPVISSLLYGYLSCSNSATNGFMAFGTLNTNFNLTGHVFTEADTILDFVSEADYSSGRGDGQTVLTSAKISMMQNLYNASQPSQNIIYFDNKSTLPLIIGIALIGITSIAGLYILKRKNA